MSGQLRANVALVTRTVRDNGTDCTRLFRLSTFVQYALPKAFINETITSSQDGRRVIVL